MSQYDLLGLFKVAEVELIYRAEKDVQHKLIVNEAEVAYHVLRDTWDMNKIDLVEQFKIILLNHDLSCLGISEISTGGISKCLVDPKLVFATALKSRATSMILAHNHPSGNLAPSVADINLTRKLVDGGKLLDIVVADHLTLSRHGYYSMANAGLIM
jgi:DNA repair protein RadC